MISAVVSTGWTFHSLSFAPFNPVNLTGGWAGLGAGFPLAIYLFIGWENSTMLAEETELQRRLWTDPPRGGFVIQSAAPVAVAAALS